jgi:hypothetical protein
MLSVSESLQSITQPTVDLADILGYGPEINRQLSLRGGTLFLK